MFGPSLWVEGASSVAGVGVIGSSSGPTDRRWAFSLVLHQTEKDPPGDFVADPEGSFSVWRWRWEPS